MKNMLITQSTEYDCGPTTITNAIRFLFQRQEIPPALIKGIWLYCNDTYDAEGHIGKHGTSKAAIRFMAHWLTKFGEGYHIPIKADYCEDDDALIQPGSRTYECLREGGVALMRCWSAGYGHYVLLTTLLGDRVGLFDPYDEPDETVPDLPGLSIIYDQPCRMNRILSLDILNRTDKTDYAMGELNLRENLLIWRQ